VQGFQILHVLLLAFWPYPESTAVEPEELEIGANRRAGQPGFVDSRTKLGLSMGTLCFVHGCYLAPALQLIHHRMSILLLGYRSVEPFPDPNILCSSWFPTTLEDRSSSNVPSPKRRAPICGRGYGGERFGQPGRLLVCYVWIYMLID